jgi:hypothetical protein
MRYRMDCNAIMSLSFNPANMVCEGCKMRGKHSLVGKDPMILVATDQNFPATLYSTDEKACIAVMRVEFGTMKEIGFAVGDMLVGWSCLWAAQRWLDLSLIWMHRESQVTQELARTMRILSEILGNNVLVVSIPPVLLGGVNSLRLVRAIIETEFWDEGLEGSDNAYLSNTRRTVMEKNVVHWAGCFEKPKEEVHIVPKGVFTEDKLHFRSVGWTKSPVRVSPVSEESKAAILDCLLRELRVNFAARISRNLKVDTKVGRDTIVVFLGLDNGIFYEADEDGERSLEV